MQIKALRLGSEEPVQLAAILGDAQTIGISTLTTYGTLTAHHLATT